MSDLSSWFGRKPGTPTPRGPSRNWEYELEALEAEAKSAVRAFQGTPLNKAGDLCLRAGDRNRALRYYGRAIDALLADGQREAARGVANKIIRVHPGAIRTLCTLTWLDLAARHMATALLHLRDYVEAAKKGEQETITANQIRAMARVACHGEFLAAAADALDGLGFAGWADEVREWAKAGGSPTAIQDPEALAAHCLEAALGANTSGS
jgi:tetratricopeptide (TPR) repeat protein